MYDYQDVVHHESEPIPTDMEIDKEQLEKELGGY